MSLPFTVDELNAAIADGDVTERQHPTLPLYIYNYSPSVQYENKWNNVTENCRGLILDEDYNIVARPWKKFYNLGQVNLPIQFTDPVEVMDKADGSLGILYTWDNGYAIATRGSFASEQAVHATQVLNQTYRQDFGNFDVMVKDFTFLFEIVYSANRIVLDYGDMDDLILLGCVENATGYYHGPREAQSYIAWNGPVVDVYAFNTISGALANMGRKNKEGYVIRSHNFMVKVKEPDYIDLHRLVTNASPKTVWEQLKDGKSKSDIVSAFPDEFHDYIGGMVDPLVDAFNDRLYNILNGYSKALATVERLWLAEGHDPADRPDRKTYAQGFKKFKDAKYFFLLLDNRPLVSVLWSELKPAGTSPGETV